MGYESRKTGSRCWKGMVWLAATVVSALAVAPVFAETTILYPTTATPTGTVTNPTNALGDDDSGALISSNSSSLGLAGFPSTNLGTISDVTVWVKYRTTAAPADDTYQCDAAIDGSTFNQSILASTTANQATYATASLSLGTLTWAQVGTLAIRCSTNKNKGADGYELDLDVGYSFITYTPSATTTLGDGTDPAASPTICPADGPSPGPPTLLDAFSFVTNTGTDNVDDVTVTFAAGTAEALSLVEITNVAGDTVYGTVANPATDTVLIDLTGAPVLTATTSLTEYRVRITPKTHANLPSPTDYVVTGTVTAFTPATNNSAGADIDSDTVTIGNAPPGDASWGTITPGDSEITLNWTSALSVVILRSTASIGDAPVEGQLYAAGNTIGSSTVVFAGDGATYTDTEPVNGTGYYYKIFTRDDCANYSPGVQTGPHTPQGTTTVGDGTDPAVSPTLCPGDGAVELDAFTLQTTNDDDTVTAVQVSFAAGTAVGLSLVEITGEGGTPVYGSQANPSDTQVVTLGSPITATASLTQYKVRVTPKANADLPGPPGSTYAVTGTVTGITSSNLKSYNDTDSDTVTIDNLAPDDATWGTITPDDSQISLSWTNPVSDFDSVVILRSTASIGDAPTEGDATYTQGQAIGASLVVYVGPATSFVDNATNNPGNAPVNGTDYYYKIFARDTCVNYASGAQTGPHAPTGTPTTTVGDGIDPSDIAGLCPGGATVDLDAFTLQTSTGTDDVTAVEVTFAAGTASGVSQVSITSDDGLTTYGSATDPTDTQLVTLSTNIGASTTETQYKVRISPKGHTELPAPPGSDINVTATVTAITSSNDPVYNDVDSATVTIDNLVPPEDAAWGTVTPGDNQIQLHWTNPNQPSQKDFYGVMILRNTAPITDQPTEGLTYPKGSTFPGGSIVVYSYTGTTPATSLLDDDANLPGNAPVNGTNYYYKIFVLDYCHNWTQGGVQTGPHTPQATTTVGNGTDPSAAPSLCPGDSATELDAFTLAASSGTDTVTQLQVTFAAGTAAGISLVEITGNGGSPLYGSVADPADTQSVPLGAGIGVTTSPIQYKVRVTPKAHADMPSPPGASYPVTGTVTSITSSNLPVYNDSSSDTVTIDNLAPANATWGTVTTSDSQVSLAWSNPGADFDSVVILRSTSAITDTPEEGSSYSQGNDPRQQPRGLCRLWHQLPRQRHQQPRQSASQRHRLLLQGLRQRSLRQLRCGSPDRAPHSECSYRHHRGQRHRPGQRSAVVPEWGCHRSRRLHPGHQHRAPIP